LLKPDLLRLGIAYALDLFLMLRNCAFVAMPLRDAVEKVLGAWVIQVLLGSFDCGGKKRRLRSG
jgi:hypothetical protein